MVMEKEEEKIGGSKAKKIKNSQPEFGGAFMYSVHILVYIHPGGVETRLVSFLK